MRREEKYPNTSTFYYYNANPKNRITTDCVTRALCTALDIPYNQVVIELAELQCKTGYDTSDKALFDKYLQAKGWTKYKQPRKRDNTKYTGEEFCRELSKENGCFNYKRVVANIGGHHIVAIIDGRVHDIWDSTSKCIGNYWAK